MKTNIERYGYANPFADETVQQRIRERNLSIHGVENLAKTPEVREKIKESLRKVRPATDAKIRKTNIERYGVEYPLQNKEVYSKGRKTCQERYGVEYPLQSEHFREKFKATCIKRYGVEYPLQSEHFREKFKATCIKRYGVEYPSQTLKVHSKQLSSSFSKKMYIFPSGRTALVQGYEDRALDVLLEKYDESSISVPVDFCIKYQFEGIDRVYFPDIYVKEDNLIIEVKSKFTYSIDPLKTAAKLEECQRQGYDVELMILE